MGKSPKSGGYILWELTRFSLHHRLRCRPGRAPTPSNSCAILVANSNIETMIGSANNCLRQNTGTVLGWVSSCTWEAGSDLHSKSCRPTAMIRKSRSNLRVATWKVGTLIPPEKNSGSVRDAVEA